MGVGAAGVKRELMGLAGGKLRVGPAPGFGEGREAEVPRAVDEQDAVTSFVEAGFDKQRAVFDEELDLRVVGEPSVQGGATFGDAGVDDGFEPLLERSIVKGRGGDGPAVRCAILVERVVAEDGVELFTDARFVEGGAGESVGVDHPAAPPLKQLSNGGLAAAGRTGEAEHGLARPGEIENFRGA